MPTYISYNVTDQDSIRIYLSDSIVVGTCHRSDLSKLSQLPDTSKPGIYILLDENKRYVGQATGGVQSRLNSHEKNKDWWTTLIFISHAYGALSPDKLNYLEAKLIKDFTELGYDMDNGNGGIQNSYIGTQQRIEAEKFLHDALECLTQIAQVNLHAKAPRRKSYAAPSVTPPPMVKTVDSSQIFQAPFTIEDKDGRKLRGDYFTGQDDGLYAQYVIELSKDPAYAQELITYFSAAWRIQNEIAKHRESNSRYYVSGYNGVFVHPHGKQTRHLVEALADLKRYSEHLKLEVKVTDALGQDMLAGVSIQKTQAQRHEGKKVTKKVNNIVTDKLGNKLESKALGGTTGTYIQWLRKIAETQELSVKLFDLAHTSRVTLLTVSEVDPSPEGKQFYGKVTDKLWAYIVLSKNKGLENLQEISDYLNLDAKCELLESN